jgi:hypothetical protein
MVQSGCVDQITRPQERSAHRRSARALGISICWNASVGPMGASYGNYQSLRTDAAQKTGSIPSAKWGAMMRRWENRNVSNDETAGTL